MNCGTVLIRESPLCVAYKIYTKNEFNNDTMVLVDRKYTNASKYDSNDIVLIEIQIVK